MKKRQKRAFTLTELLVTVVIIGILSAVVLPKFNKVMEGIKTGEAERMLTAVRTEQEARCTLGQDYLADGDKVRAFPGNTSKNYTYAFTGNGMSAESKTSNYTLQMPSYMDGRICCEGTGCAGLNKDYPTCEALKALPNYQPGTECAAAPVAPPPTPQGCGEKPTQPEDKPCGCNNTGHQSYTWNEGTCQWEAGACEGEDTSGCSSTPLLRLCGGSNEVVEGFEDWFDASEICYAAGMEFPASKAGQTIPNDATEEDIVNLCCQKCSEGSYRTDQGICCPDGTSAIWNRNTGNFECESCSDQGPNYYMDEDGNCKRRFSMQAAQMVIVAGQVYEQFVPKFDSCSFDFTGKTVNACYVTSQERYDTKTQQSYTTYEANPMNDDLCDSCDANSTECHVATCYDPLDYEKQKGVFGNPEKSKLYFDQSAPGPDGCAGTVKADVPAWYSLIGTREDHGDRYLCGMDAAGGGNGVWLSSTGAPTNYCESCGKKSKEVMLFNNLMKPNGGPLCDNVYMVDDVHNHLHTIQDYDWYDYWYALGGTSGLDVDWYQIYEDGKTELVAENWYEITEEDKQNVLKKTNWSALYTEEEFCNLFGIDPENLTYLGWLTLQNAYYGNNVKYNPEFVEGESGGFIWERIYESTSDGFDQDAWMDWMSYLGEEGKLPENYSNEGKGSHDCPSSVRMCAAPMVIPVKGYACRRNK